MANLERRTRLPHPNFKESIPEVILRRKMYEHKGVYFLGQPDFDMVMRQSMMSFEDELQQVSMGDKPVEAIRKYVYFIEGIPGSGKTYTANHLVLPYLQAASERIHKSYGVDVQVRYLQWDNLEDALIAERVINPVRGQPFSPQELRTVGIFLKLLTAYTLRADGRIPRRDIEHLLIDSFLIQPIGNETRPETINRASHIFQNLLEKFDLKIDHQSPYKMLVIEKNGATAIKTKNGSPGEKRKWTPPSRQYFPDMLDDLHHQGVPFDGIKRSSLFTTAIGCVGGPSMEVLIRSRELLNSVSLEEANTIYTSLGLRKLEKETKELASYGGSMRQIAAAREQIWPQLLHMPRDANNVDQIISRLPPYIHEMISLTHPPIAFPASVWGDQQGAEFASQAVTYSKLLEPVNTTEQLYIAEYLFWATCFRLAEASLLMNNLLDDVDCGTVIINNPIFKLTEAARGLLHIRHGLHI